ncbi:MAG: hypothetical protein WBP29_03975 [Candidatus Zixiibacteriota bacterium]
MKLFYLFVFALALCTSAIAAPRELAVVNGLGETLDIVNLTDSAVAPFVDALGLFPNDFAVAANRGIAINSGSNDLYLYDMSAKQRTGRLFLGNSRNPYFGAFLNPDTFYVTNLVSSTVTKVNAADSSIISEFAVGDGLDTDSPQGIVIRDRRAYICLTSFNALFEYDAGKLEVRDCNNDTLIARVTVGVNPQVAEFGYDGYIYILCTGNYADIQGWLFKFDPAANRVVDSLHVGGAPGGLAITKQDIAFLSAGGWPPPVKASPSGLVFVDRRFEFSPSKSGGLVYTVNLSTFTNIHSAANPLNADWGVTAILSISDSTVVTCNFADDTITEIDSAGVVLARFNVGDGPLAVAKFPDCFAVEGDADYSGLITVSDAVFLINYIFAGGPVPTIAGCGDMDCTGIITISDAVAVINYIFAGGPGSCGCAD